MKQILAARHFSEKLVSEIATGRIVLHLWRQNVDHPWVWRLDTTLKKIIHVGRPKKIQFCTTSERKSFKPRLNIQDLFTPLLMMLTMRSMVYLYLLALCYWCKKYVFVKQKNFFSGKILTCAPLPLLLMSRYALVTMMFLSSNEVGLFFHRLTKQ